MNVASWKLAIIKLLLTGEQMTKLYAPHQLRVIDELAELEDKRVKLNDFITSEKFETIVPDQMERIRLNAQLYYMTKYSDTLADRINHF